MNIVTMPLGMLGTNCYLLTSAEENCAVIDPGAQPEKIVNYLEESGLTPQYILLTHGHHDHIGGVKKLMKKYPEARLYIGREDMEMLADAQKSLAIFRTPNADDFLISSALPVMEGEELALDELAVKVLETPGHTKGGVCYLCNDALFSGDTLFRDDVGRTDLYGGDFEALKASLAKLAALKGDYYLYPGHGESSTLDYERDNNPYIKGNPSVEGNTLR